MRELKANYNIHVLIIVEPRVSGQRADIIASRLGYNNNIELRQKASQAVFGFCGKEIELILILLAPQVNVFIVSYLTEREKKLFFLTCVYGSPTPQLDRVFGCNLRQSITHWETINGFESVTFKAYKAVEDKQGVLVLMLNLCLILIIVVSLVISWI